MTPRRVAALWWAAVLAIGLAGASCGGSSASGGCAPNGTGLHLQARNTAYDATCLAAPAGQDFTITFDNQDPGVPHSFELFAKDPSADPSAARLFRGKIVTGPVTTTYEIGALDAGTYFFRCEVHPTQMNGRFLVR